MNEKKFCFIICTNSETYFNECLHYIEKLVIPEGYEIDVLGITEAKSMTSGYNEGMKATDAKYKIYMHQDVFILYPYFLQAVLDIFNSDNKIGMIGMVGAPCLPADGIMWHTYRCGNLYLKGDNLSGKYQYKLQDGLGDVQAIDGLMMVTSVDIPWREDIFSGWDFYDVSQSIEMVRAGYRVVVPEQVEAWCQHDDGVLNMMRYNQYRQICLLEYKELG